MQSLNLPLIPNWLAWICTVLGIGGAPSAYFGIKGYFRPRRSKLIVSRKSTRIMIPSDERLTVTYNDDPLRDPVITVATLRLTGPNDLSAEDVGRINLTLAIPGNSIPGLDGTTLIGTLGDTDTKISFNQQWPILRPTWHAIPRILRVGESFTVSFLTDGTPASLTVTADVPNLSIDAHD